MDGWASENCSYHMMSRLPHTLLTLYYSLCITGMETVSFSLAPAPLAGLFIHTSMHACMQYVCLRASQFESENKTRANQYVCLRASQFESESKTRAEQRAVCLRAWQFGS
jgi:hypothetical protein